MTKQSTNLIDSRIYHIYWEDRCIMRGLDEDTFQETWKNLMWTYNTELNYVEITVSEDGDLAITESSY